MPLISEKQATYCLELLAKAHGHRGSDKQKSRNVKFWFMVHKIDMRKNVLHSQVHKLHADSLDLWN